MTRYINKADVVAEIERIRTLVGDGKFLSEYESGCRDTTLDICDDILSFLDTLKVRDVEEEAVSEDLEEAAFDYAEACKYDGGEKLLCVEHFKAGAQWKKQKNTLEVKDVDIEKIIEQTYYDGSVMDTADIDHVAYENAALYFYELGLKSQKGE